MCKCLFLYENVQILIFVQIRTNVKNDVNSQYLNPKPADNAKQAETQAVIPGEDLKPLYDFTIDCKACQSKLTAAQADLTDEKKKTTSLTHERDDALRIARGGTAWRRIARAAKWFLIGAAAGAVAAKAAH